MIKINKADFNEIATKEDFVRFLKDLSIDFTNNNNEWENVSINDYLSSIGAWCHDCDFENHFKDGNNVNWRMISLLFYSGKIYE